MIKEHPVFIQPSDENIKIWRYLDFTKFIALLDSQSLFFSRSDKLGDPFEGSYPKGSIAIRENSYRNHFKDSDLDKLLNLLRSASDTWRKFVTINCWHMNNHESAAMWKLYLKSNDGIAIQSTYQKLKKSIIDERDVFTGIVKYIDYEIEVFKPGNLLIPFLFKRKSFEHESEVRAVTIIPSTINEKENGEPRVQGLNIKVNLNDLIENIYVSPNSQQWFVELVQSVINKFQYKFELLQSNLNATPLY
jgi:hypothetical protein